MVLIVVGTNDSNVCVMYVTYLVFITTSVVVFDNHIQSSSDRRGSSCLSVISHVSSSWAGTECCRCVFLYSFPIKITPCCDEGMA